MRFALRLMSVLTFAFLLSFLFASRSALAQQPLKTLLVDMDHRPATSLDGDWHYLVDMTGRSLYTADGAVHDGGYGMNEHPALIGERRVQEYDFASAPTL